MFTLNISIFCDKGNSNELKSFLSDFFEKKNYLSIHQLITDKDSEECTYSVQITCKNWEIELNKMEAEFIPTLKSLNFEVFYLHSILEKIY